MTAAHIDLDGVADTAMVDPKTVQRWLNAAFRTRAIAGSSLSCSARKRPIFGPRPPMAHASATPARQELITLYPQRADVPAELWSALFRRAERAIDIVVYAAVFLHEQDPDLNELLREKATAGWRVRIAIGDPDGEHIRARGNEERFGHGIASRCQLALMHYRPLLGHPRISIHLHDTTLYNSIYRFDDELLVNTYVWGWNAYGAPVLHVRRLAGGRLFSTYAQSFEAIWEESQPAA